MSDFELIIASISNLHACDWPDLAGRRHVPDGPLTLKRVPGKRAPRKMRVMVHVHTTSGCPSDTGKALSL